MINDVNFARFHRFGYFALQPRVAKGKRPPGADASRAQNVPLAHAAADPGPGPAPDLGPERSSTDARERRRSGILVDATVASRRMMLPGACRRRRHSRCYA